MSPFTIIWQEIHCRADSSPTRACCIVFMSRTIMIKINANSPRHGWPMCYIPIELVYCKHISLLILVDALIYIK